MPSKPIDYSKTVIYKIQHIEKDDVCYVGHTTNFDSRKKQHKKSSLNEEGPLYIKIRIHGGWDMFEMVPVKKVHCADRIEALIEEQKVIDEMKPTKQTPSAYEQLQAERLIIRQQKIDTQIERENERYEKKKAKLIKKGIEFMEKKTRQLKIEATK